MRSSEVLLSLLNLYYREIAGPFQRMDVIKKMEGQKCQTLYAADENSLVWCTEQPTGKKTK